MPSRLRFEKQTSAGRRTENISIIAGPHCPLTSRAVQGGLAAALHARGIDDRRLMFGFGRVNADDGFLIDDASLLLECLMVHVFLLMIWWVDDVWSELQSNSTSLSTIMQQPMG